MTLTMVAPFNGPVPFGIRKTAYTVPGATTSILKELAICNNSVGPDTYFLDPMDLCMDSLGTVYVTDRGSNCIKRITSTGVVDVLAGGNTAGHADGTGDAATFNVPTGICIDSTGTNLYVCDLGNNLIRKVVIGAGNTSVVTTIAGQFGVATNTNGTPGTAGTLAGPTKLCITPDDSTLYITCASTVALRKYVIGTTALTTMANATTSQAGICINSAGTVLYYIGPGSAAVYQYVIGTTTQSQFCGGVASAYANGNVAANIRFNFSTNGTYAGIAIDAAGNLYVADSGNACIRKISVTSTGAFSNVQTFLGFGDPTATTATPVLTPGVTPVEGFGLAARLYSPIGIFISGTNTARGEVMLITDDLNNAGAFSSVVYRSSLVEGYLNHVAGTCWSANIAGKVAISCATLNGIARAQSGNVVVNVYLVPSGQTLDTRKHAIFRRITVGPGQTQLIGLNTNMLTGDFLVVEGVTFGATCRVSVGEIT